MCGGSLCVNPIHYTQKAIASTKWGYPDHEEPECSPHGSEPEFAYDDTWSAEEVGNLLEIALSSLAAMPSDTDQVVVRAIPKLFLRKLRP